MTAEDIQTSYQESFQFLQTRKQRQASQLVLLNNLNRGEQNIASTLLITLFNRLVSSLYDDKMQVKFLPSQGINQEQLNAFNTLAQSDYIEMDKAKLDYDWCWDTLFFGRGYLETLRFDKKRKIMQPHVINPLVLGYDPYFENPQDWRYYWKWITKSKWELKKLIKKGIITGVTDVSQIMAGQDEYLWEYKTKRDAALKGQQPPIQSAEADVYQILEFYGYNDEGKKCVYWVDKGFSTILFEDTLDLGDGEQIIAPDGQILEGDSKWPIVVKEAFRTPHASIPFSVADLLEDKHRAKSVLLNLAYIAAKDRANPIYGYNPDKVRDISQFFNRQISQHIPMDSQDAVFPLNTEDPMSAGLIQFISMLTQEANDPVGTGQIGQPMAAKGDKTATHDAIQQQMNDMAQSLQSKVMQFGEADFWSAWFHRYAKDADSLGMKIANIVGVKGITTQEIDLALFNTKFPPGVMVFSAKEAEYKEMMLRRDLQDMMPVLSTTMDAEGLRNFYKHVLMPKYLQDPSLIDIMFPKTLDEMKAEGENEQLALNKLPQVQPTDADETHIYIHHMVQPKTWAVWFHINAHEQALAQKKSQQPQGQGQEGGDVAKSIGFKDLPPDGQVQMAAQTGIKLDPSQLQQNQETGSPNKANKPPGKGQKPLGKESATTPLKGQMQSSTKPLTNNNIK